MLRAWYLIGRSGGRWPTPFSQDPVIWVIAAVIVWLVLCSLLPADWAVEVFTFGILAVAVGVFIIGVHGIINKK